MAVPDFDAKQTKLGCNPRFGNDGVAVKMALQRHSLKTGAARIELAQIRAAPVFRRISEAFFAARSFHQLAEASLVSSLAPSPAEVQEENPPGAELEAAEASNVSPSNSGLSVIIPPPYTPPHAAQPAPDPGPPL